MTPEAFQRIYPQLVAWIATTVQRHASESRSVVSAGFARLPRYFTSSLLERARFVPVAKVPSPPLAALGLPQFAAFEQMEAAGITFLDTYFVRQDQMGSERLHFHELIHVVQWKLLGPEKFVATYTEGLERSGYRESPLEVMAYDAEEAFACGGVPFDAEQYVREQLNR